MTWSYLLLQLFNDYHDNLFDTRVFQFSVTVGEKWLAITFFLLFEQEPDCLKFVKMCSLKAFRVFCKLHINIESIFLEDCKIGCWKMEKIDFINYSWTLKFKLIATFKFLKVFPIQTAHLMFFQHYMVKPQRFYLL